MPTTTDVYDLLDFSQIHIYNDYDINSTEDMQLKYYNQTDIYQDLFKKPHMIGEHGYGDYSNDPHMYNLHDNLWSTLFNGSMAPASFWLFRYVEEQQALNTYIGISNFVKELPSLSRNHRPKVVDNTEFRIYYLKDTNEDEYYGWVQDANFTFNNIYINYPDYLTSFDSAERPPNSSTSGTINFPVSRKGIYEIKWFNTVTGLLEVTETVSTNTSNLTLSMPFSLRNGIHGDASFIVEFQCDSQWNTSVLYDNAPPNMRANSPLATSSNNQVFYIGDDHRIHNMYWNDFFWYHSVLEDNAPQNVREDSDLAVSSNNQVFFIADDDKIHVMYWTVGNGWQESVLYNFAPANVRSSSSLAIDDSDNVYFVGTDKRVHKYSYNGGWQESTLNTSAPKNILHNSDLAIDVDGDIYYVGEDSKMHRYYEVGNNWNHEIINNNSGIRTAVMVIDGKWRHTSLSPLVCDPTVKTIYYVADDHRIHIFWENSSNNMIHAVLNSSAPQDVRIRTDLAVTNQSGKVFYISSSDKIHQYYYSSGWHHAINNSLDPNNVLNSLCSDGQHLFYEGSNEKVWSSYWSCNDLFKLNETEDEEINFFDDKDITIYPNPTDGVFGIKCTFQSFELIISNSIGQVVLKKKCKIEKGDITYFDITSYPSGIYNITIYSENNKETISFIKE